MPVERSTVDLEQRRATVKLEKKKAQQQLSALGDDEIDRRGCRIKKEKRAEAVVWRAEQQQRQALLLVSTMESTPRTQAKRLHDVKRKDEEELRRVDARIAFLMGDGCAPTKREDAAGGRGNTAAGNMVCDPGFASVGCCFGLIADMAQYVHDRCDNCSERRGCW